jgi:hypothetical protein
VQISEKLLISRGKAQEARRRRRRGQGGERREQAGEKGKWIGGKRKGGKRE